MRKFDKNQVKFSIMLDEKLGFKMNFVKAGNAKCSRNSRFFVCFYLKSVF